MTPGRIRVRGGDQGSLMCTLEALKPYFPGVTPDDIKLIQDDSKYCPNTGESAGSRSHFANGKASILAAQNLANAMRKPDGTYRTYDEMVAEGIPTRYEGNWEARAEWEEFKLLDPNTGVGSPTYAYTYALFMSEVEVEVATGKVTVIGMTCVDWVGKIGNIQLPAKRGGQLSLEEINNKIFTLLANIDPGARVAQLNDPASHTLLAATKSHIFHGMRYTDEAFLRETSRPLANNITHPVNGRQGDIDRFSIKTCAVIQIAYQIKDDSRLFTDLNHIQATQIPLIDHLGCFTQGICGRRKIKGNSRWIGDSKTRRHVTHGLTHIEANSNFIALLRDIH